MLPAVDECCTSKARRGLITGGTGASRRAPEAPTRRCTGRVAALRILGGRSLGRGLVHAEVWLSHRTRSGVGGRRSSCTHPRSPSHSHHRLQPQRPLRPHHRRAPRRSPRHLDPPEVELRRQVGSCKGAQRHYRHKKHRPPNRLQRLLLRLQQSLAPRRQLRAGTGNRHLSRRRPSQLHTRRPLRRGR